MKKRCCKYCGLTLKKRSNESNYSFCTRSHCDKSCSAKSTGLKRRDKIVDKRLRVCEYCGNPYKRRSNEKPGRYKKRKYCSNECKLAALPKYTKGKKAHNNRRIRRRCVWCGTVKYVSPAFANRPYCNRQCMKRHYGSGIKAGENHHNWQGGITEDVSRYILYPGYKNWRKFVYRRDSFTCVVCLSAKSNQLRAHHIKPVSKYPGLVCDGDNGITVCIGCHKKIHYGDLKKLRFILKENAWKLGGPRSCKKLVRKLRRNQHASL